ncbi:glutamate-5-semialdehyde dehydrogenase [Pararhodonellum marinum]|uniref:glutamate-5-semialdehyde dehydrogenase n=1 Tax=Pararhodonellum marinum TaxID=2755358 RepID=UPI00188F3D9A|nr:glutamate-5-semialdehyde dehydrogenase [Pararhodonellum marinum]
MDLTETFQESKNAARKLIQLDKKITSQILYDLAALTLENKEFILAENKKDLDRMAQDDPKYDRLKLSPERLESIAEDLKTVADLPSPLAKILEEKTLENGMSLRKITVPIGVLGIIYEARPNVTFDVFAISLKSGNGLILKGGSDAHASNTAILTLIHQVLRKHHVDPSTVTLLPADRQSTEALLQAVGFVDLIIPRGSQNLIDFVRQNAKVPVIETGAGIVHTYFDQSADLQKGIKIIDNAKTRRVSVCNALDCLLIHQDRLGDLGAISGPLLEKGVQIYADEQSFEILVKQHPKSTGIFKAKSEHFGTEFLSMKMSIKTVSGLTEAIDHISQYSSKHSEAILAEDPNVIEEFLNRIDAAVVYANASTAFTDGGQFGMGAEIGISTQKLHARGPMALKELTSYKWLVKGNGHTRS